MFTIGLCELNIKIVNKYDYIEKMCKDYITESEKVHFEVECTNEEILKENENLSQNFDIGYLESLAIYRKICSILPSYNAYLMHGAVIEYKGEGIAFLATSGTGKTTHIKLWRKLLGTKVNIINGDKPIIRIKNNIPYVYGTPWAGKERWQRNTSAPLTHLVFVNRGKENSCEKIDSKQALFPLLKQIFTTPDTQLYIMDLIGRTLSYTNQYNLYCNTDIQAAKICHDCIYKD